MECLLASICDRFFIDFNDFWKQVGMENRSKIGQKRHRETDAKKKAIRRRLGAIMRRSGNRSEGPGGPVPGIPPGPPPSAPGPGTLVIY